MLSKPAQQLSPNPGVRAGLLAALLFAAPTFASEIRVPSVNEPITHEAGATNAFSCSVVHPENTSVKSVRSPGLALGINPSAFGLKKILLYRVDFSDAVGAAIASNAAVDLITGLADFYREMSSGQMTFALAGTGSVVTTAVRLPEPSTAYDNNFVKLLNATRAAAADAGYRNGDFDFDIVCTGAKPFLVFGALAYVGAPGVWIGNNNFNVGVAGHELGHNLGLAHASFWSTGDRSTIGPGGREEYGDPFDSMGVPGGNTSHFNARYKQFLGWIPPVDAPRVTTNGTYRIFAHDHPQAAGTRALRIARSATQDYWVEFRQLFANRWITNGTGLRWGGLDATNTLLLDMTPGTSLTKTDSALVIGRTFSDPCGELHITPVCKGQTVPESLDVVVNRGPFRGNLPPTVTVSASSTNVSSGSTVSFQAAASDPNGDALAYYWEFGDTFFGSNQPAMDYRWAADGEYVARCTVSDMKGGRASQSVVVRVGTVSTFRASGRALARGRPIEGVLVRVGSRASYTDTDGSYTVSRLPAGTPSFNAVLDGHSFFPVVISNSVTVGPNATNIDFAALPDNLNTLTLVPPGAIWKYLDNGSDPSPTWATPGFDDASWKSGHAKLGYGDGDESTIVDSGPDPDHRHVTIYFRHHFVVEDAGKIDHLILRLRRDDAALVRLNGQEIARDNLPAGAVATGTFAVAEVNGAGEGTFFRLLLPVSTLASGANVLAVEIHQASTNSPDLGFDLELIGVSEDPGALHPGLAARLAGNRFELAWPMGTPQWLLQRSIDLSKPAWFSATNAVGSSNGLNAVSIGPDGNKEFYRLRKYLWCEPR